MHPAETPPFLHCPISAAVSEFVGTQPTDNGVVNLVIYRRNNRGISQLTVLRKEAPSLLFLGEYKSLIK